MFNVRVYLTNACLACFDVAITAACYFAVRSPQTGAMMQRAGLWLFVLTVWLSLSCYFGIYRSRRLDSLLADIVILFKVSLAGWLLIHAASTLLPGWTGEFRTTAFVGLSFAALALARSLLRLCLRELRRRGHNIKRLVLIGSPDAGSRLEEKIRQRSYYGYRVVRRFDWIETDEASGSLRESVTAFLRSTPVDDVILALPGRACELCASLVKDCEAYGINVRIVPDLSPFIRAETQIYDFDGIPLINARLYPSEYMRYIVVKRTFDIAISVLVLTLLSPLFFVLSLLIRLTSRGPVFFTQDRVGMNGKQFRIIKFRTMHQSASLDPDSHWTVDNDHYITPLGRWLRRTDLDELPQFLNVLKGEMSVVGPRPERPFFLERFRNEVPEYMARHYVKSGITGWAQVNGWRGDTAIPERVAHDLFYIRNWAISFDIKILFLTLARMVVPGVAGFPRERQGSPRA